MYPSYIPCYPPHRSGSQVTYTPYMYHSYISLLHNLLILLQIWHPDDIHPSYIPLLYVPLLHTLPPLLQIWHPGDTYPSYIPISDLVPRWHVCLLYAPQIWHSGGMYPFYISSYPFYRPGTQLASTLAPRWHMPLLNILTPFFKSWHQNACPRTGLALAPRWHCPYTPPKYPATLFTDLAPRCQTCQNTVSSHIFTA